MADLRLHPDRLLPAEPQVREVARRLYTAVRDLPIVSPHGHVDPRMLRDGPPFTDPTNLFVRPDHYVTRLLHAGGITLDRLGVGAGPLPEERAREAWRQLASVPGDPGALLVRRRALRDLRHHPAAFRRQRRLLYDVISAKPAQPSHRPRALLERFGIEFLATTDDPADDLAAHAALAADPG